MQEAETNFPLHLFHQGTNYQAYLFLGAHPCICDNQQGYVFRVWAPHAKGVSLVGDFNGWDERSHVMRKMIDGETFELFVANLTVYESYMFCIHTYDGRVIYKADPYAFHAETPAAHSRNASKLYDLSNFSWKDATYLDKRNHTNIYASPMNVYEVNLLSWKRRSDGRYYTYRELATELVDYVVKMGYTHVEIMPIAEYPFDGSWGYQVTGYYAVTSRLGTPKDFMYLVDAFHAAGIGVILDWVPAHFPKDFFGLYEFDGAPLYEPSQWHRMENKGWGTRCFDYGRNEVVSFLISAAVFWLDIFHIDGLRVDAVSAMLYLDYDRAPGEWMPNVYGENKNLEAINFLQRLNATVAKFFPGVVMIAEESTAWPQVTTPVKDGGLGFHFKWNMGWMNDVLSYIKLDPVYRQYAHNKLTFPLMYAFSEKYVLPISHDEVVHMKGSLINKMPGSYEDKFAGIRVFMGYMMSHPGKKLHFMSSEFGQFDEWNYQTGIEFFLKEFPLHNKLSIMVQELNRLYKSTPALYEIDDSWDGFEWLEVDEASKNFIAYQRKDKKGRRLIALINFSGTELCRYRLGLPKGSYKVIFNSDWTQFGGRCSIERQIYTTSKTYSHGKEYSIEFDIPKLACVYLEKNN